jgi:ATP-dependent DNA helicase RecQ
VHRTTASAQQLNRTLRRVFGHDALRPGQEDVIRAVMSGRDTLAVMPTGSGKSLCYQIPGLHLKGTTVVVSPLISLMKDQVEKLGDVGIDASQLNSALTKAELEEMLARLRNGSEFVFTTRSGLPAITTSSRC